VPGAGADQVAIDDAVVGKAEVAHRPRSSSSCFAERVPRRLTCQPPWRERSGAEQPGWRARRAIIRDRPCSRLLRPMYPRCDSRLSGGWRPPADRAGYPRPRLGPARALRVVHSCWSPPGSAHPASRIRRADSPVGTVGILHLHVSSSGCRIPGRPSRLPRATGRGVTSLTRQPPGDRPVQRRRPPRPTVPCAGDA
jgi:hypothetical protein